MAFTGSEVRAALAGLPESAFGVDSLEKRAAWVDYVMSVDEEPKNKHDLFFYASTARVLADVAGSVEPADICDAHMRQVIISGMAVNTKPFPDESEGVQWKAFVVKPAHVNLALRVQSKAQQSSAASAPGPSSQADQTAQAIAKWAEVQNAKAEKEAKRGTLSFNLEARVTEVGLQCIQKLSPELLPTEESLLRMENLASAKVARDKSRKWVGSSEGEDLIVNFRPGFSKTPKLDLLLGSGSLDDKARDAREAKRARTAEERTGFLGFANFMGHLHDWGLKMVLSKVITPVQFWAYELQLVKMSEEQGGGRVVFYYDMLLRQKLAHALELGQNDQIEALLCKLDRDVLQDAKHQVSKRAEEASRVTGKQPAAAGGNAGARKCDQKGGKGGGAKTSPAPASPLLRRSRGPAASRKPKGKGAGGKGPEQKWEQNWGKKQAWKQSEQKWSNW
ncbi:unnamed protein product [Prorocentrum cordatum]|uniref:Uncharacterized protein n=1 Tax=Prorocentrum cordatum TaxID=2364126 RepID=A0ABN9X1M9_9DINO|nr:unnamed protein product [Polarella glacialis]